jgi:hypothetical protein
VISEHDTKESAGERLMALLGKVGGRATWAGVRPIEECAKCGADFNTSERHSCLAFLQEKHTGDQETLEIELLSCDYPARFCPVCSREIARVIEHEAA